MDELRSDSNINHVKDFEPIPEDIIAIFPEGLIRQNLILPVEKKEGRLKALVPKTMGVIKPEGLQLVAGCPVDLVIAPLDEITSFINSHFDHSQSAVPVLNLDTDKIVGSVMMPPLAQTVDIPNQLKMLLDAAIKNRASDVLIEQRNKTYRFRMKIRGVWVQDGPWKEWSKDTVRGLYTLVREIGDVHKENGIRWVEAKRPFEQNSEQYNVVIKLSETHETGVLSIHIRQQTQNFYDPHKWGMDTKQADEYEKLIHQRRGTVLFCGKERDGITDILYGSVRELIKKDLHVISVEQDVSDWIPQTDQFNAAGDSQKFEDYLRAGIRHSPDLLIVDPLRSREQVDTCLRAAMDGIFIFAHKNAWDAADVLAQLVSMGVDPYLAGYGISGVVISRTIRLNCARCQKRDPARREQMKDMGIPIGLQPASFFRGVGCESCHHSGFDKETSIFEVIGITDEIRSIFHSGITAEKIRQFFKTRKEITTLRQSALRKAIAGQTSLAEVIRVSSR